MDRNTIESAIITLDNLIAADANESDFQGWFEANPMVFNVLGYRRVIPQPLLTENGSVRYRPDFLVEKIEGLWEIFEIKRPDTVILRDSDRRAKFYSSMESYVSQCREYSEYFNDKSHREEFGNRYSENVQIHPSSTLVAGRNDGLNREKVHTLLSGRFPSITHQTYDDIYNSLEFHRAKLFSDFEELPGFSIHLVFAIEKPPKEEKNYIFDIGKSVERNRISLYVDTNGDLVCQIIDASGGLHVSRVCQGNETFTYGQTFYLSLEVGLADTYSIVVLETNGIYRSEYKACGFSLSIESPPPIVIGSDITGQSESWIGMVEYLILKQTLPFNHKMSIRGYIIERNHSALTNPNIKPQRISFTGNQFLYSVKHPYFPDEPGYEPRGHDLIQGDPNRCPRFRTDSK